MSSLQTCAETLLFNIFINKGEEGLVLNSWYKTTVMV